MMIDSRLMWVWLNGWYFRYFNTSELNTIKFHSIIMSRRSSFLPFFVPSFVPSFLPSFLQHFLTSFYILLTFSSFQYLFDFSYIYYSSLIAIGLSPSISNSKISEFNKSYEKNNFGKFYEFQWWSTQGGCGYD